MRLSLSPLLLVRGEADDNQELADGRTRDLAEKLLVAKARAWAGRGNMMIVKSVNQQYILFIKGKLEFGV
jgi:hypothetical protein